MTNELIIVGGGTSIRQFPQETLKTVLSNKITLACNYAYRYFPHTFMCFVDEKLYAPSVAYVQNGQYKDVTSELKQLPLIIGRYDDKLKGKQFPNTILVKPSGEYNGSESYNKGFYHPCLCGLFAISLAMYTLDYKGIIYLLGYDWTRTSSDTHFYTDLPHRGIGYTSFYERHNPVNYFKQFLLEKQIQIYNVSLASTIDTFPKISDVTFFDMLSKDSINQAEVQEDIRRKFVHCQVR